MEQKKGFAYEKSSTPKGLVWDTNMAAVSLFWDIDMAAVTSCENTLYCFKPLTIENEIEDITWPRGDTKFLFECWKKYFTSERSERVKYFSTLEEKFCISKQPCNVLFIIYTYTNELPNHFTLIVFWCERGDLLFSHSNGDIFTREDNMLFSHVKISSFRAKAHLVFLWCLYNKNNSSF